LNYRTRKSFERQLIEASFPRLAHFLENHVGTACPYVAFKITDGPEAFMIGLLGEYLLWHNFDSTLPKFVVSPWHNGRAPDGRSTRA
jgi:hypothetical protein